VSCWSVTADSTLSDSGDGRCVVRTRGDGDVTGLMEVGDQGGLSKQSRMFEVTVGDATMRIDLGHEVFLHVFRERVSPDVSLSRVVEVDSPHAGLGSVGGT